MKCVLAISAKLEPFCFHFWIFLLLFLLFLFQPIWKNFVFFILSKNFLLREKLLVVVVNDKLTWKEHLHGDNDNEGMITQLRNRVEIHEQEEISNFLLETSQGWTSLAVLYCNSILRGQYCIGIATFWKMSNTQYKEILAKN